MQNGVTAQIRTCSQQNVRLSTDGKRQQLVGQQAPVAVEWDATVSLRRLDRLAVVPGGPVLRAVGSSKELVPETGRQSVEIGDRIFLTSTSAGFAFTEELMNAAAGYRADRPLREAVAALADRVRALRPVEEIMIVGAEVARPGTFLA